MAKSILEAINKINDKKIEERSNKSQEKHADQLMTFSTSIFLVGNTGMLALLGKAWKPSSNLEFFSAVIVYLVCLICSFFLRKEAFDVYDRIYKEDAKIPKNSSTKRK